MYLECVLGAIPGIGNIGGGSSSVKIVLVSSKNVISMSINEV